MAAAPVKHFRVSYNDIHNLIRKATPTIAKEFNPDLLVAIGGGGFFPARVIRTFLRELTDNKSLTIQAIGLSLYEPAPGMTEEQIGNEVVRTQWLSDAGKKLVGKRVLVVDEVDDTRKTLSYALSELQKDIDAELATRSPEEAAKLRAETKLSIFVVHNKDKPKLAQLPEGTPYWAGETLGDLWLDYPWEQTDIEEHDKEAAADKKALKQ